MATNENHLIELLPRKDRLRVMGLCEPVQLVMGTVLCEPGVRTRHVYFPVDGFISLLTLLEGKPALEVGLVGHEGMLGAQLALGVVTAPLYAQVLADGAAWRIGTGAFRRELSANPTLQQSLNRYLYVLMSQLAVSAACLRYHLIGPRLARRLLMSQDRANSNHFRVTHEQLANTLGVRRVGITAAAGNLQRAGLIEYHRGELAVIDRDGLEAAACSCYASDRQAYTEILG